MRRSTMEPTQSTMQKTMAFGTLIACLLLVPIVGYAQPETVSFTARLGVDTLAVERITYSEGALKAEALVRTPRTVLMRYELRMDSDGALKHLETSSVDPISGKLLSRGLYDRIGDSLRIETLRGERRLVQTISAPKDALPFVDLMHWPFDLMLRRMRQRSMATWDAPMVSRNRISQFPIAVLGSDSATVTHPTRGTMRVLLRPDGGIRTLDATATTRALIVTEGGDPDINALALMFAKRDAGGRGIGALSGRDTTRARDMGADIMVEFGTPTKRGREIWGSLVKFGKLWRTGANRATHFKTSKELRFGEVEVPPGEYTLFTIPEKSGGVLIINKQTGQTGTRYDSQNDLGRVAMHPRELPEAVEMFTIRVDEVAGEGLIRFQWGGTEYVANFEVVR